MPCHMTTGVYSQITAFKNIIKVLIYTIARIIVTVNNINQKVVFRSNKINIIKASLKINTGQ